MSNFLIGNPKCVFIHIPKTGGTSIRKGIFTYCGQAKFYMPDKWEKYFKFAFVRNPYDRAVSGWRYFRREKFTFLDFLKIATDDTINYELGAGHTIKEFIRHHTITQLHPFNCIKYADFIGRFENFQEDFNKICDLLNVERRTMPHLNKTEHDHYTKYYNDQTREIVTNYYRSDIQEFGYIFGEN